MSTFSNFWQHVFRNPDPDLQRVMGIGDERLDEVSATRSSVLKLMRRVDKLELLCAALTRLLMLKHDLSEAELRQMMVRLDLADGREDGLMNPKHAKGVPMCTTCNNPLNPKRKDCVYCGEAITSEMLRPPPPPRREVTCGLCRETFEERSGFFSEHGLVCQACYSNPDRVVKAQQGAMSLAETHQRGGLSIDDSGQLGLVDEP